MSQEPRRFLEPLDAQARAPLCVVGGSLEGAAPPTSVRFIVHSTYSGLHLPLKRGREGTPTQRSTLRILGLVRPVPGVERQSVLS